MIKINKIKKEFQDKVQSSKINELAKRDKHEDLEKEKVDVVIPKQRSSTDTQHILTQTIKESELKRKHQFITTISDDRGEEVKYAGIPLSKLIKNKNGIGDIIGLL